MRIGILRTSCFPRCVLLILACLFLSACGRADKEYEKAFTENSIQAYQAALEHYPDHARAGEARTRLETLLFTDCTSSRNQNSCETYLTRFPEGSRAVEIAAIRDEIAIEAALTGENPSDEFTAYEKLIRDFPNQKTLVRFNSSFSGFLERFIPPGQICSGDRPGLEKLLSEQNLTLDQIDGFPGLRVVTPNNPDTSATHEIPEGLCPVPMWEADRLGVFDPPEEQPDGSVIQRFDFGELSKKVFTFIAKRDESNYRIIAVRLVSPDPKPGE
jgi:hypothetical protein